MLKINLQNNTMKIVNILHMIYDTTPPHSKSFIYPSSPVSVGVHVLGGERGLHGLKHVTALLGVALSDLLESLVLVPALGDILRVEDVILGLGSF